MTSATTLGLVARAAGSDTVPTIAVGDALADASFGQDDHRQPSLFDPAVSPRSKDSGQGRLLIEPYSPQGLVPEVDWAVLAPLRGFDAVVGNPPFLNQLEKATVRDPQRMKILRERFGDAVAGYTDTAYLFVLLALEITRGGGSVGLILPESFLAARDASGTRRRIARDAQLRWLWRSVDQVFAASVRVVAPVFDVNERVQQTYSIGRAFGISFEPLVPHTIDRGEFEAQATWSSLFSDLNGVPEVRPTPGGTIGDVAKATADFRDQYYGLIPHVFDAATTQPTYDDVALITVGLIDPAQNLWGTRRVKFGKVAFEAPMVRRKSLRTEEKLDRWATSRLVPKIMLATQSRTLEAYVDVDGTLLPSIPVITITANLVSAWHLAAALTSPVLTAWAIRHYGGAALSADAIKLSAKQVAGLPLPWACSSWDAAAVAFREAQAASNEIIRREHVLACGRHMCDAYEIGDEVELLHWWASRLPTRGGATISEP